MSEFKRDENLFFKEDEGNGGLIYWNDMKTYFRHEIQYKRPELWIGEHKIPSGYRIITQYTEKTNNLNRELEKPEYSSLSMKDYPGAKKKKYFILSEIPNIGDGIKIDLIRESTNW